VPESPTRKYLTRFRILSGIAALLVILLCVLIAAGRYLFIAELWELIPNGGGVFLAECVLFALLAVFAVAMTLAGNRIWCQLPVSIASVALAGAAVAKFVEHEQHALWFPYWEIVRPGDNPPLRFPDNVGVDVCILVSLYAGALVFSSLRIRIRGKWLLYQIMAICAAGISTIPIIGFVTGQESLCTASGCMKQHVAIMIISMLTAFAILFRDIADSPLEVVAAPNRKGAMARAGLFLIFIGCPLIFAFKQLLIALVGADQGLSSTLSLTALIAVAAKLLWSANSMDSPAKAAESVDTTVIVNRQPAREGVPEGTTIISQQGAKAEPMPVPQRANAVVLRCPECKRVYSDNLELCPGCDVELIIEVQDRLIGTTFAEKYAIDALLGKGGMSTVYLARHLFMGTQVAIKLMHSGTLSDVTAVRRFQHESKTMSRLKHPNVLDARDFGFFDGLPYMVMDYVQGKSLAALIKEHGALPRRQFFDLALPICSGLHHAHQQGIVHRDLKPANIMIVRDDDGNIQPKIVDFGLAKLMSSDVHLTQTGECMGSPLYMSPEQCMSSANIDHLSDIYSLGCVFYECLTGIQPIQGDSILDVLQKHMSAAPLAFPEDSLTPIDLQQLIYRMMAKAPQDRPQSANQIYNALMRVEQTTRVAGV
jgi:tRNA A-37 threonylcarbamoyl transferase component Bud32/RNA polymerase subunit RPABC4/transcription elongation factor Spt4